MHFPSVEIDREAALDTLAEIARNHFVARRAMLLRMAEERRENAGLTAPGLQRLAERYSIQTFILWSITDMYCNLSDPCEID